MANKPATNKATKSNKKPAKAKPEAAPVETPVEASADNLQADAGASADNLQAEASAPADNFQPEAAPVQAEPVQAEPQAAPSGRWRIEHADLVKFADNSEDAWEALEAMIEQSGQPYGAGSRIVDTAPVPVEPEPEPEVVKPEPVKAKPVPAPAPVVAATAADKQQDDGAVNEAAAARIAAQHEAIRKAGLAVGELWYPPGTPLYAYSKETAARMVREADSLPKASVALPALVARVASENRRDVTIADVTQIKMDATGAFIIPGEPVACRPTKRGIQSVQADLGISVVDSLQAARARFRDPSLAVAGIAANWNAWTDNVQAERSEKDKPKARLARIRNVDNEPVLYALVSDGYANEIHTGDVALHVWEMLQSLGMDPATALQYSGDKIQIDLVLPTPVDPGELHVGDCWKIQIRVRSDDTGQGSLRVSTGLFFARCRNFSVSMTEQSEMNKKHTGDSAMLARLLREAIGSAHTKVQPLIAAWNASVSDNLLDALPASSPARGMSLEEALPGWTRALLATPEMVAVLPRKNGETAKAIVNAWKQDTGPGSLHDGKATRAGLVNAFTRFAHESADPWAQDTIERIASSYLDPAKAIGWLADKK